MWQCLDWSCCNANTYSLHVDFTTWNMPHGATCTPYLIRAKFKFRPWNSHDHRYHQTPLSRARNGKGRKKRQKQPRENDYACSKVENTTQFVIVYGLVQRNLLSDNTGCPWVPELHASSGVREPISLHKAEYTSVLNVLVEIFVGDICDIFQIAKIRKM